MKKTLLFLMAIFTVSGVFAQTFCVAGNGNNDPNGNFCGGLFWDAASNAMTGTNPYTITFTNVGAGTYEFKITDGSWANSWGAASYTGVVVDGIILSGGNMKFTIPVASDITITFDGTDKKITSLTSSNGFGNLSISVYTLIGSSTLFGGTEDFDLTNTANDMIMEGSLWKKTYNNVLAGTYLYKVVGNHSYAVYEYPGISQNQEIEVTEDNSTLVFTFDPATPALTCVATVPSNIDKTLEDNKLIISNGTIICKIEPLSIYNLTGQDVTSQNGNLSGIYIVKCNGQVQKVMVK